jgi:hypothetical protein
MDAIGQTDQGELGQFLQRLGRHLRWRDSLLMLQKTAWLAFAAGLLIHLAGRLLPIPNLVLWMLIPIPAWLFGLLIYSLLRPMHQIAIARRIDQELRLQERLGTAYLLEKQITGPLDQSQAQPIFQEELVKLQQLDAISKARVIDPRREMPLVWQVRPLVISACLVLGLLLLTIIPNPMDEIIAQRVAIVQAAEEQAQAIERLHEEIAGAEELSPELQEELLRHLAELADELRANPGDLSEALADISSVEEALRAQLDPQTSLLQPTLEALAAQLQDLAGGESSQGTDLSDAAEALNHLAEMMSEMDAGQREELAQALAQMAARTAQAGETSLAQALASLAGAAQTGDNQAATQAASQAGEAFEQAQRKFSDQASLQQALSRLQDSRLVLGQAGQGPRLAQGSGLGQSESSGEGEGEAEGQGEGQSPGQGQGQPGGGGGTTANTLPPGTSTGSAGRPQGEGQTGGVTGLGEQVYAPWERNLNSEEEIYIPGQDTDQGDTQVRESTDPLPGVYNPALMPYYDVYYTYVEAANQIIEQSYIPSGLKDYVRDYFTNLEP